MTITNSSIDDIDTIFALYEAGTLYQKSLGRKQWMGFERSLIEKDIAEKRQWKIIIEDEIACVFTIVFNDPVLWKERDKDPAIYIHRISVNPSFRGNGFVKHITQWARYYATESGKQFIRMDTGSGNEKLNDYYISCGFNYLGVVEYDDTGNLPAHYSNGKSSGLFEIKIG